jgi:hypothetical protein
LLGFLSDEGVPLDRWKEYKEKGKLVLYEAIHEHYSGLFAIFPDAPQLAYRDLEVWFHPPLTGKTRSAVDRSIKTFRKLCQFAGIVPNNSITNADESSRLPAVGLRPRMSQGTRGEKPLLVLNPPNDSDDYIRFFEAYKVVFLDE